MYTEREELLDDIAEMWREKEVEREQEKGSKADAKALEVERKNAAVGMRAAALGRYKEKRSAAAAATGEEGAEKRPVAALEPPRKRLDIPALIAQRNEQRQQELDLRRQELQMAQEKMKSEAEERRLMLELLKKNMQ